LLEGLRKDVLPLDLEFVVLCVHAVVPEGEQQEKVLVLLPAHFIVNRQHLGFLMRVKDPVVVAKKELLCGLDLNVLKQLGSRLLGPLEHLRLQVDPLVDGFVLERFRRDPFRLADPPQHVNESREVF
jgi:hypothetical protein